MLKRGPYAAHLRLFIALILGAAIVWPASAAALGFGGFDVSRPNAKNPDASLHFKLRPGESREAIFVIRNTTSDTVQNLHVYIADGLAARNSGITLKAREARKTGLARWITLDTAEQLSLAPGEERRVKLTVKVPYISSSDEQVAGIVVESAETIQNQDERQFNIKILPRVAILITQRLPGPAIERLNIVKFNETWAPKGRLKLFHLRVKNEGNIHLEPKAKIVITDMFGRQAASFPARLGNIFPKSNKEIAARWQKTPIIGYFTAEATIEYGKAKSDSRTISFLIFPWWVLAILPALWMIARQQRKRRAAKELKELEELETEQAAMAALENLEVTVEAIEAASEPMAAKATAVKKPAATKKTAASKTAAAKTEKPAKTKAATVKKAAAPKPAKAAAAKKPVAPKKPVAAKKPAETPKKKPAPKKPAAKKPAPKKKP